MSHITFHYTTQHVNTLYSHRIIRQDTSIASIHYYCTPIRPIHYYYTPITSIHYYYTPITSIRYYYTPITSIHYFKSETIISKNN